MTKRARPHLISATPVDAGPPAVRVPTPAERIGAALRNLCLNQAAVAELIGVHAVTLSRWLHETGTPPAFQLALVDALAKSGASPWVLGRLMVKCGVVPALAYALRHTCPVVTEAKRRGSYGTVYKITLNGRTFEL